MRLYFWVPLAKSADRAGILSYVPLRSFFTRHLVLQHVSFPLSRVSLALTCAPWRRPFSTYGSNERFYANASIPIRSLNSVHTPDLSEPDSEVLDSMQLPPYALDYGSERSPL